MDEDGTRIADGERLHAAGAPKPAMTRGEEHQGREEHHGRQEHHGLAAVGRAGTARVPRSVKVVGALCLAASLMLAAQPAAEAASDMLTAPMLSSRTPVLPLPRPGSEETLQPPGVPAAGAVTMPGVPAVPYAQPNTPNTGKPSGQEVPLYLVAKLTPDGKPLNGGVVWRVFGDHPDAAGKLPLVAVAAGGDGEFRLRPGVYFVHAAYGRAGATSRVDLTRSVVSETVVLHAGGLELDAVIDENIPLPADEVTFDIFKAEEDASGERPAVVRGVKPGVIVRLPAGTYHVASHYGGVNAVMRADIEVEAGKLVKATLHHKAAEVTLKLVAKHGGEALANTQWSVKAEDGKVVAEKMGAFPSLVLAEGKYEIVAKNGEKTYSQSFDVEAGQNRDLEVVAQDMR